MFVRAWLVIVVVYTRLCVRSYILRDGGVCDNCSERGHTNTSVYIIHEHTPSCCPPP